MTEQQTLPKRQQHRHQIALQVSNFNRRDEEIANKMREFLEPCVLLGENKNEETGEVQNKSVDIVEYSRDEKGFTVITTEKAYKLDQRQLSYFKLFWSVAPHFRVFVTNPPSFSTNADIWNNFGCPPVLAALRERRDATFIVCGPNKCSIRH
jgi:hypothetical protein